MAERNSNSTFAISLVAGTAGMLLALLFAPRSGRETRQRIGMATTNAKDRASDNMEDLRANAEDGLQRARDIKDRLSATIKARDKQSEAHNNNNQSSVRSPILTSWDEEV